MNSGEYLRAKLFLAKKPGNWYTDYDHLDTFPILTKNIQDLQLWQIKAFKHANSDKQAQVKQLNLFLQKIEAQLTNGDGLDEYFNKMLQALNAGLGAWKKNGDSYGPYDPSPAKAEAIANYQNNVLSFLEMIASASGGKIPEYFTNELSYMQGRFSGTVASRSSGSKEIMNYYEYRQLKADLWENIAAWILECAGFDESLVTGRWVDEAGKQLIFDVLAADADQQLSASESNGLLKMRLRITGESGKGKNTELQAALQEHFQNYDSTVSVGDLDSLNWVEVLIEPTFKNVQDIQQLAIEQHLTIKVPKTFEDDVRAKYAAAQAKSGYDQSVLNKQERNNLSRATIYDNYDTGGYLNLLSDFYNNNKSRFKKATKDAQVTEFDAYIQYLFTKNILKSKLTENTLYFTGHGFSTLDQQMQKGHYYFELKPIIYTLRNLAAVSSFEINQAEV